jgi:hypothetical protein
MLGDHTDLDDTALTSETAAAMRELASTVTDAPPLRLSPRLPTVPSSRRFRQRWAAWITPLAAAAAVIALAITLVTLKISPNGPVVPPAKPAPASGSVPTYYAELVQEPGNPDNPDRIQARQTLTGKLIATVNPPAGATFAGITGAADDRTFVVDTQAGAIQSPNSSPDQQSVQPRTWYLLRLSPESGRPASLTPLTIPRSPAGTSVMGMALSPDGTKLAAAFETPGWGISPAGSMTLRVYSVQTGAVLRSWTAPYGKDRYLFPPAAGFADDNLSLAWAGAGTALAFGQLTLAPGLVNDGALPPPHALTGVEILELPYTTPSGANLLSARVAFTLPGAAQDTSAELSCGEAATTDLVFTAAGQLLCGGTAMIRDPGSLGGNCASGTPWYRFGLLEYSTSGAARALRQYASNCDGQTALLPLWTSPSGSTQLGLLGLQKSATESSLAFGIVRDGKFTALPTPAALDSQEGFPLPLSYTAW